MEARLADRITSTKGILGGKPAIRGTRISVELILSLLADGWSEAQVLESYPHITREDVLACIAFARDVVVEDFELTTAA